MTASSRASPPPASTSNSRGRRSSAFETGGSDAFEGLPDDACQSPHWGYLFKGSFRLRYTDGSEALVRAGEAYYAPPGHQFEALEDCETVEFSPTKELQETLAVVGPNVERFLEGAGSAE